MKKINENKNPFADFLDKDSQSESFIENIHKVDIFEEKTQRVFPESKICESSDSSMTKISQTQKAVVCDETLFLSEKIREKLRIPLGKLYKGVGLDIFLKSTFPSEMQYDCKHTQHVCSIRKDILDAVKVISVGDATLFQLLDSNILPDIMIIDGLIQRKPISEHISIAIKKATKFQKIVTNPPGSITLNLIEEIEDALNETVPIQIVIKGEDDLAALPAILMAPINSIVLYGQPNEGLVVVKVTESKKEEIRELFNQIINNSQQKILNFGKNDNKNILNIIRKINEY